MQMRNHTAVFLRFFAATVIALSVVGCGFDDEETEFNKPAAYWYTQLVNAIGVGNLDKADETYISLKSEHVRSPLLPTATLMLAYAHMHNEEYLLARFYFDEYTKRFAGERDYDYIAYMKLKAAFLSITDIYKDQKLIVDTIQKAQTFQLRYPGSTYSPLVNTLRVRLEMALYMLNDNIAALYDRIGKPKAAAIYREKNGKSLIRKADISPPQKGVIARIFD